MKVVLSGNNIEASLERITGLLRMKCRLSRKQAKACFPRRGMQALGGSDNLHTLNRGEQVERGGITININQVIQAWDAQDVWRNRKALSNAIADDIYNNGKIRAVIRSYT